MNGNPKQINKTTANEIRTLPRIQPPPQSPAGVIAVTYKQFQSLVKRSNVETDSLRGAKSIVSSSPAYAVVGTFESQASTPWEQN